MRGERVQLGRGEGVPPTATCPLLRFPRSALLALLSRPRSGSSARMEHPFADFEVSGRSCSLSLAAVGVGGERRRLSS